MAENSKIEWTDHTFNPWIGCAKVSDGCKNCYAEAQNKYRKWAEWGVDGTRKRTSESYWRKPLNWNRYAGVNGIRQKVFCASLADVFEDRDDLIEWRIDLFRLIFDTPNLDWLILTKRPENVNQFIDDACWPETGCPIFDEKLPDNVWMGVSVENQEQADKRISELLKIPAAKHFLSMEPLLGMVDLIGKDDQSSCLHPYEDDFKIDWVIVGGESGSNARPMHPAWVTYIRDQCEGPEVPFFFKQWGEWAPCYEAVEGWTCLSQAKGNEIRTRITENVEIRVNGWDDSMVAKVGKKKAGRLIGGYAWDEVPE